MNWIEIKCWNIHIQNSHTYLCRQARVYFSFCINFHPVLHYIINKQEGLCLSTKRERADPGYVTTLHAGARCHWNPSARHCSCTGRTLHSTSVFRDVLIPPVYNALIIQRSQELLEFESRLLTLTDCGRKTTHSACLFDFFNFFKGPLHGKILSEFKDIFFFVYLMKQEKINSRVSLWNLVFWCNAFKCIIQKLCFAL